MNVVDRLARAADHDGAAAQGVGVLVEQDHASAVEQHDVLDEVADLVDEVGREHDGPRVLGVVGEQAVVEELPGHGVEPEVGLVEERQRGA